MPENASELERSASSSFEAEQIVEDIAAGEQEAPKVNVAQDYEASKDFSDADPTSNGAEAAFESKLDDSPDAIGNPKDFLEMAREVSPELEADDLEADASGDASVTEGEDPDSKELES
ncbi:MAG: hypothetical protein KME35_05175 [Aphanocapsa sp. GSE-SYN-MK-11-07L]|jgi:hypothetical protein|nr:hypothetical protein [Aphanocapsa sp. GSE-SYN-MK-11-07L]